MVRAIGAAAVVAAALVIVHLAAGGGDYAPTPPGDPCTREVRAAGETDVIGTAQRVGLIALDATACELRVSRERVLLAVAGEEELGVDDDRRDEAFRAGLGRAIDSEEQAGRLGAAEAALLRTGVELLPVAELLDQVFTR
ncbi:MAG: hypothetical protein M3389_03060 [Actinomycetota bacterium]|nr:hypothetical protein [Actinomycetota bacterium]